MYVYRERDIAMYIHIYIYIYIYIYYPGHHSLLRVALDAEHQDRQREANNGTLTLRTSP